MKKKKKGEKRGSTKTSEAPSTRVHAERRKKASTKSGTKGGKNGSRNCMARGGETRTRRAQNFDKTKTDLLRSREPPYREGKKETPND